jgi:hypothetical protein
VDKRIAVTRRRARIIQLFLNMDNAPDLFIIRLPLFPKPLLYDENSWKRGKVQDNSEKGKP